MSNALVDALIVGVPKAGTTWLASVLDQHPEITISDPKEPNIVASHKGTFFRNEKEPNWDRYEKCFGNEGLRIDASIHAFACPLAPKRFSEKVGNLKLILCLREPVGRAFSHWQMVLDTGADKRNDADWSEFAEAWKDERLNCDSLYSRAMKNWLEYYSLDDFLIVDSDRMRTDAETVLNEVEGFLNIENFEFDLDYAKDANSASDRRPMTFFGKLMKTCLSLIPKFIKRPIVNRLQEKGVNIYAAPVLSRTPPNRILDDSIYELCSERLTSELIEFGQLTGFDTSEWVKVIEDRSSKS